MYKPILLVLGIFIALDLVVIVLGIDEAILNIAVGFMVSFTVGITGNNLYRLHALRRIREISDGRTSEQDLKQEVQLRGGTSYWGVLLTVVLVGVYVLIAMTMVRFVPPINQLEEAESEYSIESEIREVLENNIQALATENTDEYMTMVYTHAEQITFAEIKKMLHDLFDNYDLAYTLSNLEFLSISEQEVKVRVTQLTTLVEGENFRNNESTIIHTLRPQKEMWKFFNSEVESIQYLDEGASIQTKEETSSSATSNTTKIEAPSMFDFLITKEVDINNDGILETISFRGGAQEKNSYLNENVEIRVEFDGLEITPLTVSAENAPILYLYDINQDGRMELFFETGARITGTEMYQITQDGLVYVTTFNGSVKEFAPNEVITSEGNYLVPV